MFKRLYYRLLRDITAMKLLGSLVANPECHKHTAHLVECGQLSKKSARDKDVTEAIVMADQFIAGIKSRNTLDKNKNR